MAFGLLSSQLTFGACSVQTVTIPSGSSSSQSITYSICNYIIENGASISLTGANATALTITSTGSIDSLRNNGTLESSNSSGTYGIKNSTGGVIGGLINTGTISSGNVGISNNSSITSIDNSGTISGSSKGIGNTSGTISIITNSGTISSSAGYAIYIQTSSSAASIDTITNTGSLVGALAGINTVSGALGTLNNLQGAGNAAGALTYSGKLPTNYNVIITSASNYGKLAVTSGTGTTTFGIYTSSTLRNGTYASVLSGITSGNLSRTTGTFGSATWLLSNSSSDIWDLIISGVYTGPSVANTNQSLVNTASALQGAITLQNTVMVNGFTYDCAVFDKNGICVSAGGRNTQVAAGSINNTSGLLIGSYRLDANNSRIGLSLDQNFSTQMPGGTIKQSNSTPMVGVFGVWQENLDNTGWEGKASLAMGQKDTTIQRTVVGTSEPGMGSATMISQGAQATAKYGIAMMPDVMVLPYAGLRYTRNNMGGYTEATSSAVTAPLVMAPVKTNSSTALIGVEGRYRVMPDVMTYASAGVERNMSTNYDNYVATNSSIGALTPVSMNPNMVKTRPTASLGAYYDVEKNQRLGVTGIYRQEMYQAVGTTTVMATYTVGL